jgi:hypothetical protein
MQDHGDLPIEDFTHRLLQTLIEIKWLMVGLLVVGAINVLS